ncbi:AgrD family cyclic lactone autoinducer peptide [Clostridium botulinum]|uniref:AgrD family cyclic lactone autoinducer peptide n=1 Tax=Clostridium botulinum TaxID=1491 RepID=UPI000B326754|nr:cyclic lactone autoinducer peptide [Clostridium botulinum]MCD3204377.1 cyclic lactone autoinducer peptide [Clostridium botulinum C/D]MCD3222429.1 cyclic lactone autoinducer peptide [Clostridium botulinum C/D]MCD3232349.1 cyclic lactone autoinducer peptide [Clostridium botulinum C/D]MCD3254973.1 cyclic lactone autoinducer peptide [Clostridium botulinum C/D]MCD3273202.1 cyclic lactone autoinducer peptide [Clostridium botulinum C/D]
MNTMKKKISKMIANMISGVSTNIAYTSTKKCVSLNGLEEPKMPKVLLKRAK